MGKKEKGLVTNALPFKSLTCLADVPIAEPGVVSFKKANVRIHCVLDVPLVRVGVTANDDLHTRVFKNQTERAVASMNRRKGTDGDAVFIIDHCTSYRLRENIQPASLVSISGVAPLGPKR